MVVDWTWRLAGKLAVIVFLSSMAAFGTAKICMGLHLGEVVATIAMIAAWIGNFMLIDRAEK